MTAASSRSRSLRALLRRLVSQHSSTAPTPPAPDAHRSVAAVADELRADADAVFTVTLEAPRPAFDVLLLAARRLGLVTAPGARRQTMHGGRSCALDFSGSGPQVARLAALMARAAAAYDIKPTVTELRVEPGGRPQDGVTTAPPGRHGP